MLIDLIIGVFGLVIGLLLGYGGWYSSVLFVAAFLPDLDIVVNELYRIFIKNEKKLGVKNFLDEYSYSHKFIFHVPLIVLPVVFFVSGVLYPDWLFSVLVSVMILAHFVHDTVDKNWDGVPWLFPFSMFSYKFSLKTGWTKKSRNELREIADDLKKNPRESNKIFKDNLRV